MWQNVKKFKRCEYFCYLEFSFLFFKSNLPLSIIALPWAIHKLHSLLSKELGFNSKWYLMATLNTIYVEGKHNAATFQTMLRDADLRLELRLVLVPCAACEWVLRKARADRCSSLRWTLLPLFSAISISRISCSCRSFYRHKAAGWQHKWLFQVVFF